MLKICCEMKCLEIENTPKGYTEWKKKEFFADGL